VRSDDGQALAIAAVGAMVLAAALALTIDSGYALLQRRIVQNDADKVALEVARLLGTSVMPYQTNSMRFVKAGRSAGIVENLTHVDICALAQTVQQRDRRPTPTSVGTPLLWLDFERWDPESASATPASSVRANCARPSRTTVDRRTTTVRVRVERRYKSLLASLLRQPEVLVGATARAALAGAPFTVDPVDAGVLSAAESPTRGDYADLARTAPAVDPTWPIARFYRASELAGRRPCGPACDPRTTTPFTFISGSTVAPGVVLLDLSADSPRMPGTEQLITEPDPGGTSLADGFDLLFDGVLGLHTDWTDSLRPAGQDDVETLDIDRNACDTAYRWLLGVDADGSAVMPPSCRPAADGSDDNTRGDWVETIDQSIGSDLIARMQATIRAAGSPTPYSASTIPGTTRTYGRALVIWIYFWDCRQEFQTGTSWHNESCPSSTPSGGASSRAEIDRVHLFTAVPITFYEGQVTSSAVQGYWGGGFVDPGRCQTAPGSCPTLTALANSAVLIADDQPWDPTEDGVDGDEDPEEEEEVPEP
jgi:hypothetical protein